MGGNNKRSFFEFEFPVPATKHLSQKEEREKRKEDKGNHPARLA
jgi:hypothetical protein